MSGHLINELFPAHAFCKLFYATGFVCLFVCLFVGLVQRPANSSMSYFQTAQGHAF